MNMRNRALSAAALFLPALMLAAPAHGAERPAVVFRTGIRVWIKDENGKDIGGTRLTGGEVRIPKNTTWVVRPLGRDSHTPTITDAHLTAFFAAIKKYRAPGVSLERTLVSDAGLAHLRETPWLEVLNLAYCRNITDAGLAHVATLKNLRILTFIAIGHITDSGMKHISTLKSLRSLRLRSCTGVKDAGLAHIGEMTGLERLDLAHNRRNFTARGFAHLSGLTNLRDLRLNSCFKFDDEAAACLAGMTKLDELELERTAISDAGLEHIRGMTKLRKLSLERCSRVSEVGASHIAALTDLEDLNLAYTSMTDLGMLHLRKLTKVRSLSLSGCWRITDDGIETVKYMRQLGTLALLGCRQVTSDSLAHLAGHGHWISIDGRGTWITRSDVAKMIAAGARLPRFSTAPPLADAAARGDMKFIRYAIAKGISMNTKTAGSTPLHLAAKAGRLNVVRLLIAHGASVDPKRMPIETPLHLAAENGHRDVALFLIAKGADLKAKIKYGQRAGLTPLGLAVRKGHTAVIELLKRAEAGQLTEAELAAALAEPPTTSKAELPEEPPAKLVLATPLARALPTSQPASESGTRGPRFPVILAFMILLPSGILVLVLLSIRRRAARRRSH